MRIDLSPYQVNKLFAALAVAGSTYNKAAEKADKFGDNKACDHFDDMLDFCDGLIAKMATAMPADEQTTAEKFLHRSPSPFSFIKL